MICKWRFKAKLLSLCIMLRENCIKIHKRKKCGRYFGTYYQHDIHASMFKNEQIGRTDVT